MIMVLLTEHITYYRFYYHVLQEPMGFVIKVSLVKGMMEVIFGVYKTYSLVFYNNPMWSLGIFCILIKVET